jgi:integrase
MAKPKTKTAKNPAAIAKPGRYGFGGGLWLTVAPTGGRGWAYRFTIGGRSRALGLGGFPLVSLEEARAKAAEARQLARSGVDPIEQRNGAADRKGRAMSFREVADALIADLRHGWRSPKSETQWRSSLAAYAYPRLGLKDVANIDKRDVVAVLRPIWTTKPETAKRVRARIEQVLARATALDLRHGDNPAAWSLLRHLLPAASHKAQTVRHHAALNFVELPTFLRQLREAEGAAARALEFTILTAARSAEAIGARWSEIDFGRRLWVVPAHRMKADVEHIVPLGNSAMTLLLSLPRDGEYVFVADNGRRLAADSLRQVLRHMGRAEVTVHGFRSSFRDWASEETMHEQATCELALAHAIDSKVEASYRRGKLLDKRRALMDDWAAFCGDDAGKVVPLRRGGASIS